MKFGAIQPVAGGRANAGFWGQCAGFLGGVRLGVVGLLLWVALGLRAAEVGAGWQQGEGFRWRALEPAGSGRPGFTRLVPAATGITFSNVLSADRYLTNTMYLNGSGVAAGDVDGDGWCDVFFAGLDGPNRLYRNLGGWKFEEVPGAGGAACADLHCSGVALADLDGDRDLDLVINSYGGGSRVFLNTGRGGFELASQPTPLNQGLAGMTLALADVDGDGDLDLYITNYRTWTIKDRPGTKLTMEEVQGRLQVVKVDGRPVTEPDLVGRFVVNPGGGFDEQGEADLFYLNDGTGRFTAVPFVGGRFLDEEGKALKQPLYDWGLSAMFRDLNGDGAPDLYVCNDFQSPDRIWMNDGRGNFRAIPRLALRHTSVFSMGVDVADINRDGHDDIVVVDMLSRDHVTRHLQLNSLPPNPVIPGRVDDRPQYSQNMLFLNRGDGTYMDIAFASGLAASEWTWAPAFLDVDLDGYEDLIVTTGHELEMMNADVMDRAEAMKAQKRMSPLEQLQLRRMFARLNSPDVAFRNRGDLTFEDVSAAWGLEEREVSNGMALADLDNDGDMDLLVNHLNGYAGVFRNNGAAPRVAVRVKGQGANTGGVGARILVRGGPVEQRQELVAGGRYLSGDALSRTFAAQRDRSLGIDVRFRNGGVVSVTNVPPGSLCEIAEPGGTGAAKGVAAAPAQTLFENLGGRITHRHVDEPFDDFARQPLLVRKLSLLGPGVTWHDVDRDGWDDLVFPSGRGGFLRVMKNDGNGGFAAMEGAPLTRPVLRDQTTVLGIGGTLFVGLSNYEDGTTNGGSLAIYDLDRKAAGESVLFPRSATGPLAMADVDLDGDLDLFLGGRVVSGHYPEPAVSLLLRNEGGRFVMAHRWEGVSSLGMVSGAVWVDLDGDGRVELVVACEWGPIRVFGFEGTQPREMTGALGLEAFSGWWNSVAAGDFDADGRMDLVAGNWGWNHRAQARLGPGHPVRVYYGDLDGDGSVDLLETGFVPSLGKEAPDRSFMVVKGAMPFLQETFTTVEAYGKAGIAEVLGSRMAGAKVLSASTFSSVVLLNRPGRFERKELPFLAQLAPVQGIGVGDFDGDGRTDVLLAQNHFAVGRDEPRQDAGLGLLLRGIGGGGFEPMPSRLSGVEVYGDQRGCAVADYDKDGRLDAVIVQNSGPAVLLHNRAGSAGVRVRLKAGAAGNPGGVGATVRRFSGGVGGASQNVRLGGGYWSVDSPVLVFPAGGGAATFAVTWPGGKLTQHEVGPGQGGKEFVLHEDGRTEVVP